MHQHPTDTRRGPEGQPDRVRGTHRPHGMAYRQAKGRDTWTRQPATRSARDARKGRRSSGEARNGTGPESPDLRCPWRLGSCVPLVRLVVSCGFSVRAACSRPLRIFGVVRVGRGGDGCLAPGPVLWSWPAACLSGVLGGPVLGRRASSGPVALVALVSFPVAVVPSPTKVSCPW